MPPIAVVLRMPGVRVAEDLAHTLPSAQFQKLLDADFVSVGQIVKAAGTQQD
ncbi:hypothetical protein [Comamonas aquatica]|uniref:hypothetical protein n=1 Tax=Comamonas aquatica TaxID=225991 RepID=UPI0012E01D86|nr:hypothetical protein [Comamonas aquatica]